MRDGIVKRRVRVTVVAEYEIEAQPDDFAKIDADGVIRREVQVMNERGLPREGSSSTGYATIRPIDQTRVAEVLDERHPRLPAPTLPMTDAELANETRRGLACAAAEIIEESGPSNEAIVASLRRLNIGDHRRMATTLIEFRDTIRELCDLANRTAPSMPIHVALARVGFERAP